MKLPRCEIRPLDVITLMMVLLIGPGALNLIAQSKLSLESRYPRQVLNDLLIPRQEWHPYPTIEQRSFWESLPEAVRKSAIKRGEQALEGEWPSANATLYLEYARTGDRDNYQRPYFARRSRLGSLVLAECMEDRGRFIDEIVNGIWLLSEESSWVLPAHLDLLQRAGIGLPDVNEQTVDLMAAETISLLSWTYYLLKDRLDQVSPLVGERLLSEAKKRVLDPCLQRNDFWWMDFDFKRKMSNWTTYCNSHWLVTILLLEQDETRRLDAVHKSMRSVDHFIAAYPADGACDEGPGYWNMAAASLFDFLELLYNASDGKINIFNERLIRDMGGYIYRARIAGDRYINFADAAPTVNIAAESAYRYGKLTGDSLLAGFGAHLAQQKMESSPLPSGGFIRQLPALMNLKEILAANTLQPLLRDVWLSETEVFAARDKQGSERGFYVAAKGGTNYAESHSHNDIGNFILYYQGRPVLIDVGVGTYDKKTFSPERYDIWTMQSAYHNLPTINGVMQKNGNQFKSRKVVYRPSATVPEFSLDLAGAYPSEAGVDSWQRTIRLERGKQVIVRDEYKLKHRSGELFLSLITPCRVELSGPGRIRLTSTGEEGEPFTLNIIYDNARLRPELEQKSLEDRKLISFWGEGITRIILRAKETSLLSDIWTVRVAH